MRYYVIPIDGEGEGSVQYRKGGVTLLACSCVD